MIAFCIPGKSLSERKRQVRMGRHAARVDMPDRAEWKHHATACAVEAMAGRPPLDGPLLLEVCWVRARPKSAPKRVWAPTTKPDTTNLVKILEDALNKIVWRDDAQVVEAKLRKVFEFRRGGKNYGDGVWVRVSELRQDSSEWWHSFIGRIDWADDALCATYLAERARGEV